ncbi:3-dehydroquinate synthase [Aureispira]|nr:3-dehydroquinate synthase [Aureispira sp.]
MMKVQDYIIQFQGSSFLQLNEHLTTAGYSMIFVLVDRNTKRDCFPILKSALCEFELNVIEIEAGEIHKNIQTCAVIWNALMELHADRKSVLINLGGGVIGDMGGFCASTFKRGIDFIQIPTTLLAQVDASIGGKLGVDFRQVKNSIGLFKNPRAVYLNSAFFDTLPRAELLSGYAEVIKHALIVDKEYWSKLLDCPNIETNDWKAVIERSLQVKKSIVELDPFEKGIRKSLNFGHTIGHGIESLSLETDQPLLHGEAVALGMVAETYLSYKVLGLPEEELEIISNYIITLFPKYNLKILDRNEVLNLIYQDKKNEQGQVCFTLLEQVGKFKINVNVDDALILEALDYYNNL